jgi:hypothetical protein
MAIHVALVPDPEIVNLSKVSVPIIGTLVRLKNPYVKTGMVAALNGIGKFVRVFIVAVPH